MNTQGKTIAGRLRAESALLVFPPAPTRARIVAACAAEFAGAPGLDMYEGAAHAFNNDADPARYNKEAATLAWSRTIAFLKKYPD